ncbi:hypothetical protein SAMN05660860_02367 [Geoalkalibacter ferrihydriticus]|uniref:Uncharacterized protein n=2 Tax=Geoalkalibacter ferrihydriticus TaxID=392333 RepID=A0A0C2EH30_9BACT|nr:hypothetical protein [Geoalkalibacter ferrihydriticus]KIH77973.1 hypothetical protein GFER_05040 [Geoalkalibacter ferrihydriticus DSM 17813]SDM34666.1 hypothetical protein SAMN05660860_02367 [Geoalkalibacter ferrihydriticus]
MKSKVIAALVMVLGLTSPALAAGQRTDHSGIVVWTFLGFCALIVVAQLLPAVLAMLGLVKGVAQSSQEKTVEQHAKK